MTDQTAVPSTVDEVDACSDVDLLWQALVAARSAGDDELVRAAENRMRALQPEHRFRHLSDDELEERIRSLAGNREPKDLLAYSPGGAADGDSGGAADTMAMNRRIRENQADGVETTLAALVDERERRATTQD